MDDNLWTWPTYGSEGAASAPSGTTQTKGRDIIGYEVEATDGRIGKIDEASFDVDAAHLVVDTGWWIFGKKRMIPAGVVDRIDDSTQTVYVRCDKEGIKAAPDFDSDLWSTRDPAYRSRVGSYYNRF